MKPLDFPSVSENVPYKVWCSGDEYLFVTEGGFVISAGFELAEDLPFEAYWFGLYNRSHAKSPGDLRLQKTILSIAAEFFQENPGAALLYLCDTADQQQAMRSRLFTRWFNNYEGHTAFYVQTVSVSGEEEENFITMILRRDNPALKMIEKHFSKEVQQFKDNK